MQKKSAAAKKNQAKNGESHDAPNAIKMLKKDHKALKKIFKKFRSLVENGGSKKEKMVLVKEACNALAVHAQIEEEIFYPALEGAAKNSALAEAFVEHDCAKDLIEQLEEMNDDEAIFDAKFIVLGDQVKRHIEEEESDIFPKAKKAKLDLNELGAEMKARKEELEEQPSFPDRPIVREEAPAYVS